jgi:aspartate aminotransferase
MELSPSVRNLKPSATIAAAATAKALKNSGVQVYEFTLGEPDANTPPHICEAAKRAIDAGQTHYTPATGLPELKQAICDAYQRDYGLQYQLTQIAISNGAKHSLHNVLTALCAPGDEVIIPAPYWVSYSALVELAGATPVIVETTESTGFVLGPEQLEQAITPRTRLLMLNNPCNPTGAAYSVEQLEALAAVAAKRDLPVLSDEIYEKLVYDGFEFRSFATLDACNRDQVITVSGVSKAYAMTGWRIGWTIAPVELTTAMSKLQSQETSNPCSISQHAAIAALSGPQDCVAEMLSEFAKRRKYVIGRIEALPDVSMATPGGAFYAFFNVSRHFGKPLPGGKTAANSTDFCNILLEEAQVALVTGDAFGAPGYVRLSFATSLDILEAGFDRLAAFLGG